MTNFSPHVSQVIQVTNMRYGDDAADAGKKSLSLRIYKNFSNPNGNPSQMFLNRQSAEISLNCPTNFAPSHQSCCYNIETQTATLQNIAILLKILKHGKLFFKISRGFNIETQYGNTFNIETGTTI